MASTFLSAPRGGNKNFDVPIAALAGLSVAFAVFAAPPEILSGLIGASGLPAILPAAEPPLGLNARIGIGAAGAIVMFAFAFLLLRWLDRFGRRAARVESDDAGTEAEMPRLRRRDFHPDAAPRPPLCAESELGEPELELTATLDPETEAAPAPAREPELQTMPRLRRAWLPEAVAETAEEPAPNPTIEPSPEPFCQPTAESVPDEVAPAHNGSISELLDRLERGLARRRGDAPVIAAPAPAEERAAPPPVAANAADDRLQSAIDSLQRLASRQD